MDPFARDSDQEEERIDDGDHARTDGRGGVDASRATIHESVTSQDIGEDDGPPASIVLDTHDEQDALHTAKATGSDSVRLARMGKQTSSNANDMPYGSDDEQDDERAGLMGLPTHVAAAQSTASRSSSSRRRAGDTRDESVLSRMARKVRKKAERIRVQDGAHASIHDGGTPNTHRRLNAKERALWQWGTLENLDEFLQEVYGYYVGKGLVCILLTKVLNLLTIAFVIGFSTFLVGCVDYGAIKHDGKLSEVVVGQCFSRFSSLTILAFALFIGMYSWQVIRFGLGITKLVAMRNFYTHLLNVPDADVQAISWHEVVSRISHLRENHPTLSLSSSQGGDGTLAAGNASKLDAHDVANRIMRQENYLVALFNKDVLDLSVPFVRQTRTPELTRTLEWNLTFCLLGFLFDAKGQVRRQFVTERHRSELIDGLKRRFIFMAVVNAIFAPFIVIYLLFYSFFRYFEEYHKNPSYLGARQYTQFARWKFREFNELPHIFRRRCHNSYPYAQRYIDQFPKERIAIVARFVSFVAGSFTAVLLLASVIDPDLFLHFDITPQRNVLFYIGVFGAILAVSRALVPDEQQVFEPEILLRAVIEYTHYLPEHWKGHFHSADVHSEFGTLYRLKIYIFFAELLSVLFTPFILWKSLPRSAPAIIDFFREFTVHVDGLGYVCSFAVFDFKRHGNVKFGAPHAIQDARMSSKEGKMEQSLLGFRAANPTWQPTDPTASLFLSRLAAELANAPPTEPMPIGKASSSNLHDFGPGKVHYGGGVASTTAATTLPSGGPMNFTPANSTLAQRSQMYSNAFDRSILLASKPSNAAALHASATKTGLRSAPHASMINPSTLNYQHHRQSSSNAGHRTLQAVDEDTAGAAPAVASEVDPLDVNGLSVYEDARPDRIAKSDSGDQSAEQANLRGLLQHIGTSRW